MLIISLRIKNAIIDVFFHERNIFTAFTFMQLKKVLMTISRMIEDKRSSITIPIFVYTTLLRIRSTN